MYTASTIMTVLPKSSKTVYTETDRDILDKYIKKKSRAM